MNSAKLLKLAPTLVMVVFLGYTAYSVQPGSPTTPVGATGATPGEDFLGKDTLAFVARDMAGALRNPFEAATKPAPEATAPKPQNVTMAEPGPDPWEEIVQGLTLDATFLQGRDQIAIINGRIYHKDQHLVLTGASDGPYSSLFVVRVEPMKVILRAGGGKTYELAYPDKLGRRPSHGRDQGAGAAPGDAMAEIDPSGQLALFRALLNSPWGAMGQSMIGNPALDPSALPNGPAAPHSRGSRSRRGAVPRP
jgi:hypothetical protein